MIITHKWCGKVIKNPGISVKTYIVSRTGTYSEMVFRTLQRTAKLR